MECRPVGDLGLISGGISDDSITVSGSEMSFTKEVNIELSLYELTCTLKLHCSC